MKRNSVVGNYLEKLIYKGENLNSIIIEITQKCNLKCLHCYVCNRMSVRNELPKLSLETINGILQQAFEMNVIKVTFTGGEPLCHPSFGEIIQMAKEKYNMIVQVMTNATLINRLNIQQIKKYVDFVFVSKYGASSYTYETVTNVGGAFDRYLEGINMLRTHDVKYEERGILLRENECDLENFIATTKKIEKFISCNKDDPYSFDHRPSDFALKTYYEHYIAKTTNPVINCNKSEDPVCGACRNLLAITATGEVVPCSSFYYILGNIYRETLSDIWSGSKILQFRELMKYKQFTSCCKCDLNKYLFNVSPCNNLCETGDMHSPSAELCRHCKIVKGVMECKQNENKNF